MLWSPAALYFSLAAVTAVTVMAAPPPPPPPLVSDSHTNHWELAGSVSQSLNQEIVLVQLAWPASYINIIAPASHQFTVRYFLADNEYVRNIYIKYRDNHS